MDSTPAFPEPVDEDFFLRSAENSFRYKDLERFEHYFLQLLRNADYNFESPIGILADSSDALLFIIAACWDLGIPFVPFNPLSSKKELISQIDRIDPAIIFSDVDFQKDYKNHFYDLNKIDIDRILTSDEIPSINIQAQKKETEPEDIFGYFFTSGTTSSPKIVPLKRRQLHFAAQASAENIKPDNNHCWLLCLPLNHIGGISIVLRSLLYGSAIYRMDKFESREVSDLLANNQKIQAASLVPTMLNRLMERQDLTVHRNFQSILMGGGPLSEDLVKQADQKDIPLTLSYGMTESCAQIAANPLYKSDNGSFETVGRIFSPNEVEIRNNENEPVEPDVSGTIWLRGPQVFDGYQNSQYGIAFDKHGWFNTGDFGHLNDQNQLFIESRRTDLIITGGENVSPYEVESELRKLTSIKEAAVLGLPDEEWGQKVAALVVTTSDWPVEAEEIRNYLKKRMSDFKIPKVIIEVDELPRTQTGKIIRENLSSFFTD